MNDNYYVMIHDEFLCIGCQSCTVACANLNEINEPFTRLQVRIGGPVEGRYIFNRVSCRQCGDAPCVKVCPTGATFKDADGIVQMDASKCINCSYCIAACPYNVRFLDKSKGAVDKCDFCSHSRLPQGEKPACVSVCPVNALLFGRLSSPDIQHWLNNTPDVFQDERPGTGKLQLYRRKETHREVAK